MTSPAWLPIEARVRLIRALNDTWHALRSLGNAESGITRSLALLKGVHQAALLRDHPQDTLLVIDPNPALTEQCFSVRVRVRGEEQDACHLPVRVAADLLSSDEIEAFTHRPLGS